MKVADNHVETGGLEREALATFLHTQANSAFGIDSTMEKNTLKTAYNHYETEANNFLSTNNHSGFMEGGYGVTNAHSDIPVLATDGISQCIAVSIYDPATRQAAMVHVFYAGGFDEKTFKSIFAEFNPNAELDVRLVGGTLRDGIEESRKIEQSIYQALTEIDAERGSDSINIASVDTFERLGMERAGVGVALDARTGDIIFLGSKPLAADKVAGFENVPAVGRGVVYSTVRSKIGYSTGGLEGASGLHKCVDKTNPEFFPEKREDILKTIKDDLYKSLTTQLHVHPKPNISLFEQDINEALTPFYQMETPEIYQHLVHYTTAQKSMAAKEDTLLHKVATTFQQTVEAKYKNAVTIQTDQGTEEVHNSRSEPWLRFMTTTKAFGQDATKDWEALQQQTKGKNVTSIDISCYYNDSESALANKPLALGNLQKLKKAFPDATIKGLNTHTIQITDKDFNAFIAETEQAPTLGNLKAYYGLESAKGLDLSNLRDATIQITDTDIANCAAELENRSHGAPPPTTLDAVKQYLGIPDTIQINTNSLSQENQELLQAKSPSKTMESALLGRERKAVAHNVSQSDVQSQNTPNNKTQGKGQRL